MDTIKNESFRNCEIVLDGKSFQNCTFTSCDLIYRGGELPEVVDCEFVPPTGIKLDGAAGNTVNFLSNLYNHLPFGKRYIEDLFDRIRIGV